MTHKFQWEYSYNKNHKLFFRSLINICDTINLVCFQDVYHSTFTIKLVFAYLLDSICQSMYIHTYISSLDVHDVNDKNGIIFSANRIYQLNLFHCVFILSDYKDGCFEYKRQIRDREDIITRNNTLRYRKDNWSGGPGWTLRNPYIWFCEICSRAGRPNTREYAVYFSFLPRLIVQVANGLLAVVTQRHLFRFISDEMYLILRTDGVA